MLRRAVFLLIFLSSFATASETELDPIWPKLIQSDEGSLLVYQPQIDAYGQGILEAHAALALTTDNQGQEIFGSIKFHAQTKLDANSKTVLIHQGVINQIDFPSTESNSVVQRMVERLIQDGQVSIPLSRLEAGLARAEIQNSDETTAINTDAPDIYVENIPTLLVLTDGEPKLIAEDKSSILRVVNTPVDLLLDTTSSFYYLKAGEQWFRSRSLSGDWVVTTKTPRSITGLKTLGKQTQEESDEGVPLVAPSKIIVSTVPAALIQLDGEMELGPLGNSGMLYVINTSSDVLFDIESQQYYFLFAGRWFSTDSLGSQAKWIFVEPEKLPKSFSQLETEVNAPDVLSSIPGTLEAKQSIAKASIPQTAQIDRSKVALDVNYVGEPAFDNIPGTPLDYAMNTSSSVIRFRGQYYCVQDGVWFIAPTSRGPWSVATYIPQEIYTIPRSHPLHNVTYVYVYETTPRYVYTGYMPGYTGSYTYQNTVVYGTGWDYYPSYYQSYQPHYWRPHVYYQPVIPGFSLYFNIFSSNWKSQFVYNNYGYDTYDRPRKRRHYYKKHRNHRRLHNVPSNNVYGQWRNEHVVDRRFRQQRSQRFQERLKRPNRDLRQIPGTADMPNPVRRPRNRSVNTGQPVGFNVSDLTPQQRQAFESFQNRQRQTTSKRNKRQQTQQPARRQNRALLDARNNARQPQDLRPNRRNPARNMPQARSQMTKAQRQALEAYQNRQRQANPQRNLRQKTDQPARRQNKAILDAMNRAKNPQATRPNKRNPSRNAPQAKSQMPQAQKQALETYQNRQRQTAPKRQPRQKTQQPARRTAPATRQMTQAQKQMVDNYRKRQKTAPNKDKRKKR